MPSGAAAADTVEVTVDELAARVAPEDPQRQAEALRAQGMRWSVLVSWTGPGGSGTLELTQFRWPSGAQGHLSDRLTRERERPTAEEWSVPGAPGAAVFATETRAAGRVVRGLLARGPVVAEAEFGQAGTETHEAMIALIEQVAQRLPGRPGSSDTPPVAPLDVASLLVAAPAGAQVHHAAETLWLLRLGADLYDNDAAGQEHLEELGIKRGAVVGWNESDGNTYVLVNVLRFGAQAGARDWSVGTADADADARPTEDAGSVPGIEESHYLVYRSRPETRGRYGEVLLFRHEVAVMIQVYGAGATSDRLIALAQEQYARLP